MLDMFGGVLVGLAVAVVMFWECFGRYEWAVLCGDLDDVVEWGRM